MIKAVLFSSLWDTGGQGIRIKQAFDRHPALGVEARSIHTDTSYFDYPKDISTADNDTVERLFREADVLHMRNDLGGLRRLGRGQPVVLHHHGTRFREHHDQIAEYARNWPSRVIQVASTIDLTILEPDVRWLPSPYNLDVLSAMRPYLEPNHGLIRIAHAPTNRAVKSTDRIMAAIQNLHASGYNISFDLIERQNWNECLRRKALADIYIDQLNLGYGNNAVEAWGMGIPVVAGIADEKVRAAMLARWGTLPFKEANETNLEGQLAELIVDAEYRLHWSRAGLGHVRRYHEEFKVAAYLADIYHEAVAGAAREETV